MTGLGYELSCEATCVLYGRTKRSEQLLKKCETVLEAQRCSYTDWLVDVKTVIQKVVHWLRPQFKAKV